MHFVLLSFAGLAGLIAVVRLIRYFRLCGTRLSLINSKLQEEERSSWPTNTLQWSRQFREYDRLFPGGRLNRDILAMGIQVIGLVMFAVLLFMASQVIGS